MVKRSNIRAQCALFLSLLVLGAFFSEGCGKREGGRALFKKGPRGGELLFEEKLAEPTQRSERMRSDEGQPDEALPPDTDVGSTAAAAGGEPVSASFPENRPARKRVHSGSCRLLVDDVEKRLAELFALAENAGGYVESSAGNPAGGEPSVQVVLRVPAEGFRAVFDAVLALGDVIEKSEETYDVTEQYLDLGSRLTVAVKTRERLAALLGRTNDAEERLRILKEIKRLTGEIEGIRQELESLKRQVSLSRITVDLLSRLEQTSDRGERIPFRWIERLDPLAVSLPRLKGRARLSLGGDFAVFKKARSFIAESAEGTRVRAGSTKNEPRGDSAFWQRAAAYHLGKFYREANELELGRARCVLLASKDWEPYYYLVGVVARKKRLYVIEVFFPNRAAFERRLPELQRSIEGFMIR